MDIGQVTALIQQGESHSLEFKKSTTQLKPAFETVCAFLNGNGGIVLIGVSDNTRQEFAREINKIEPTAQIEISYVLLKRVASMSSLLKLIQVVMRLIPMMTVPSSAINLLRVV